jgi:hypothetical protein
MTEADIMNSSDAKPQARALKSLTTSNKALPSMSEANSMFGTNTKAKDRGIKMPSVSSRIPVTMTKTKLPIGSDPQIQSDEVGSSAFITRACLNWEPSKSDDPFGARVSTNEFGTSQTPFELANTGKFHSVRDNIMYDGGDRDATAHFEHLPDQIIQPLQPGVDHMPEPVKAHVTANIARTEAAKAGIEAAKARELSVIGDQEITTAGGLREEITNVDPTYTDTMFAAIAAAKLHPEAAWDYLNNEAVRQLRADMKTEAKEFRPAIIKEEEYATQGSTYSYSDAPTEEQELSLKAWTFPVADRVIDKAQMQYDMMYQVVTKSKFFPFLSFFSFPPTSYLPLKHVITPSHPHPLTAPSAARPPQARPRNLRLRSHSPRPRQLHYC